MKKLMLIIIIVFGIGVYIPTTETYKDIKKEIETIESYLEKVKESSNLIQETLSTLPENIDKFNASMKELEEISNDNMRKLDTKGGF